MVQVNGQEFNLYELDTLNSVYNRIAANLATLPEYLYFPNGRFSSVENFEDEKNVIVKDYLIIMRDQYSGVEFKGVYDDYKTILEERPNLKELIAIWVKQNESKITIYIKSYVITQLVELGIFKHDSDVIRFWEDIPKLFRDFGTKVNLNRGQDADQIELIETLDNAPLTRHTDFIIESVKLELKLNLQDMSLLELFNYIILNDHVPFCNCVEYYKIIKSFTPPNDWALISEEKRLLLKIYERSEFDITRYESYSNAEFKIVDDTINCYVNIDKDKYNITQDEFIKRTFGVFPGLDINILSQREIEITVNVYYPEILLNNYVFSDMVMNDDIFSKFVSIDEFEKATKTKSNLTIQFYHPAIGKTTISIIGLIVKESDLKYLPFDAKVGSPYIKARISRTNNIEVIVRCLSIFSKLLGLYIDRYKNVVADYKKYIPEFTNVISLPIQPDFKRAEVKAFVLDNPLKAPGYARQCGKQSTSITMAEAKGLPSDRVILFPRDEVKSGIVYPSDGKDQKWYTCRDPEYKYPGLVKNKHTDSSDYYPYFPCCYKTPGNKTTNYRVYYEGFEAEENKDATGKGFITTDKILSSGRSGELPSVLKNFFNILDLDLNYRYIRMGVERNVNSFITCLQRIEEAMSDNKEPPYTSEDIQYYLRDQFSGRKNGKRNASMCRQELYDQDVNDILADIADRTKYFNPRKFIRILENQYGFNVFLFDREGLVIPRHTNAYYKTLAERKPNVFIYEHLGSESDHAQYPQCEIIIKADIKDSNIFFDYFNDDTKIARNVKYIFNSIIKAYALNKEIEPIDFSRIPIKYIKNQKIDTFGKTRGLTIEYKGQTLGLITDPIPPIFVEEKDGLIIPRHSTDIVNQIVNNLNEELKIGINITDQIINKRGNVKELIGNINNIKIRIPTDGKSLPLSGTNTINDKEISYTADTKSYLDLYNRNKKYARYITEYLIWLYSNYITSSNITEASIDDFARRSITIIPDFKYGDVSKKFDMNSGVMYEGKLVVTDEDMLRRLIYVLRLQVERDLDKVLNYKHRLNIDNYYQDISDFTQNPFQVILYGENSIDSWIYDRKIEYKLQNSILIGRNTPYFFKNTLVSPDIYLAQNTFDLDQAIALSENWRKEKFNNYNSIISGGKRYDNINFKLYSYVNKNNIEPLNLIQDRDGNYYSDIKIIGYKINNIPKYTALLKL